MPDRAIISIHHRAEPAVRFTDVAVAYGDRTVVQGVTAALHPGTVVGLLGPNGAGKTTLLRALLGVLPTAQGIIRIHEMPPREAYHHVSYLPQHEEVNWDFPVTVFEVVLMGRVRALGWLSRPRARDRALAQEALARVGMEGLAGRQIGQLSRGQRQRALLARALAQDGDVVVLDEPLAGVDLPSQEAIVRLLGELRDRKALVLISLHDIGVAQETCDHLLCLNQRMTAFGPTRAVFVPEVLRATYGGMVAILDKSTGHLVANDVYG
jgi:manganese/zinc/iron transport system ATP- binding protein